VSAAAPFAKRSGALRTQALQDLLHLGSISLEELTEARLYIQDVVVRLACERATKADLEALRKNIEKTQEMIRTGGYLARIECSREFYRLLAAATHNQVVSIIVESLTEILMRFLRIRVAAGAKTQPNLVETRRQFLKTLSARNTDKASREMSSHLQAVHRLLTEGVPRRPAARAKTLSQ
jgi:GntR family transcriptional repressor for pyruvate dehydrogenase complex